MVAALCRARRSSGWTSAGRRSSPPSSSRDGAIGRTIEVPTPDGSEEAILAEIDRLVAELLADGADGGGRRRADEPRPGDRASPTARRTSRSTRSTSRAGSARASPCRWGSRTTRTPSRWPNGGSAPGWGLARSSRSRSGRESAVASCSTGACTAGGPSSGTSSWTPTGRRARATATGAGTWRPSPPGSRPTAPRESSTGSARTPTSSSGGPGPASPRRSLPSSGSATSSGIGIGSLANIFDPQVFVVGGGFGAAAGEILLEAARRTARREAIAPADERLRVVPAALGEEAGVVGAGLVGFEALDGER